MRRTKTTFWQFCTVLLCALVLAAVPPATLPAQGSVVGSSGQALFAAAEETPYRVYTFTEVGQIAQNNSPDIIRQKASVEQAESSKESQLTNYQMQVYEFYSGTGSDIREDSLYSLQTSYEDAFNRYLDAEETLEKLKPKVAYQAQKLYIDILMAEAQMRIQEQEIQRLQDEYALAKVKAAFGAITQTQLKSAKTQWDDAMETLESQRNAWSSNKNTMREYLNLADSVEFGLEDPPAIGQYGQVFDPEEVLALATKNSMALKQAKREVEEMSERIRQYEMYGEYDKANQLAASGRSTDLALKETRLSLERTVASALKDFDELEAATQKAEESLAEAKRTLDTTQMRQRMGLATVNELRQAEKAVLTAERSLAQSRYNHYLGAKKVFLLMDGILVS